MTPVLLLAQSSPTLSSAVFDALVGILNAVDAALRQGGLVVLMLLVALWAWLRAGGRRR